MAKKSSHPCLILLSPARPKVSVMFDSSRRSRRTRVQAFVAAATVALVVGLLALPALASAASSPTQQQYHSRLSPPLGVGGGGGSQDAPGSASGSVLSGDVGPLPFTGFDVVAMAAVALTVTGFGLVLQRAVARRFSE